MDDTDRKNLVLTFYNFLAFSSKPEKTNILGLGFTLIRIPSAIFEQSIFQSTSSLQKAQRSEY